MHIVLYNNLFFFRFNSIAKKIIMLNIFLFSIKMKKGEIKICICEWLSYIFLVLEFINSNP